MVDVREIIATDEDERFGARSRNAAKQPRPAPAEAPPVDGVTARFLLLRWHVHPALADQAPATRGTHDCSAWFSCASGSHRSR